YLNTIGANAGELSMNRRDFLAGMTTHVRRGLFFYTSSARRVPDAGAFGYISSMVRFVVTDFTYFVVSDDSLSGCASSSRCLMRSHDGLDALLPKPRVRTSA